MAVQKILKEDTDVAIEISDDDVLLYAEQLGIDISKEKHLLWIARKGLETPLPKPWYPVEDEKGRIYFYNRETDDSVWEHPADSYFRELVKQERNKQATVKEDTDIPIDSEKSHLLHPKKNALPGISAKSGFKLALSSLDDVPPITSGRNSMSSIADEKNMKSLSSGKKPPFLSKLQEIEEKEKPTSSFLKSNAGLNSLKSESLKYNKKSLLKNDPFDDHLIKPKSLSHVIMEQALDDRHGIQIKVDYKESEESQLSQEVTDDDLSTGLDGIGFDRFAQQFGLMDASQLSPLMPSPEQRKKGSLLKLSHQSDILQPVPKTLLESLFNTESNTDDEKDFSEIKNGDRFSHFLMNVEEELSARSSIKDESHSESKSKDNFGHHLLAENILAEMSDINEEIDSNDDSSVKNDENENNSNNVEVINDENDEFEKNVQEMSEIWKKKLEEKEESLRLEYEKQISQLEEKLNKEKSNEEEKTNGAITAIKEENALILAKQEQVLTEELEAALESFRVEIELKRLSMLKTLEEELEEKYRKEFEGKEENLKKIFESKMQDLKLKMEKDLEEEDKNMQLLHQQEVDNLIEENNAHLEEIKSNFQKLEENLELNEEVNTLKNQLEDIKKTIDVERKTLETLEEKKIQLKDFQNEESELINRIKILKDHNQEEEERKNALMNENKALQNEINELKKNIKEDNEILENLNFQKSTLEEEIEILEEELNKKEKPVDITFVDKCTDTHDLSVNDDISVPKLECDTNSGDVLQEHVLTTSSVVNDRENVSGEKDDKIEQLITKMEKSFRMLETKIENSIRSTSGQHKKAIQDSENHIEKDKIEFQTCIGVDDLNSNKEKYADPIEISPNLKTRHYHYEPSYIQNDIPQLNAEHSHCHSIIYPNMYQQQMNSTFSESETNFVPDMQYNINMQLKMYKEKLKDLQDKHQSSKLKLEYIKEEILSEVSEKSRKNKNKDIYSENFKHMTQKQSKVPPHPQDSYMHNLLVQPSENIANMTTVPTRSVPGRKWNSDVLERAQHFIQKVNYSDGNLYSPSYLVIKEKNNNPLDHFLTLTETVLDKELGILSEKKEEKHYLSCPALTEQYPTVFTACAVSQSPDRSNDNPISNYSIKVHRPTILRQSSSSVGKMITEKEDWMDKIGTMYHKIRAYERDLIIKRSVKSKF